MNWSIKWRKNHVRFVIETAMPHLIDQLKLSRYKCSAIVISDKDLPDSGLTVPHFIENDHLIVLRPDKPIHVLTTLCHEMVHVAQIASGRLVDFKWCGKKFSKNTPYMNRPWELDAYRKQEILLRRTLDRLDNIL